MLIIKKNEMINIITILLITPPQSDQNLLEKCNQSQICDGQPVLAVKAIQDMK